MNATSVTYQFQSLRFTLDEAVTFPDTLASKVLRALPFIDGRTTHTMTLSGKKIVKVKVTILDSPQLPQKPEEEEEEPSQRYTKLIELAQRLPHPNQHLNKYYQDLIKKGLKKDIINVLDILDIYEAFLCEDSIERKTSLDLYVNNILNKSTQNQSIEIINNFEIFLLSLRSKNLSAAFQSKIDQGKKLLKSKPFASDILNLQKEMMTLLEFEEKENKPPEENRSIPPKRTLITFDKESERLSVDKCKKALVFIKEKLGVLYPETLLNLEKKLDDPTPGSTIESVFEIKNYLEKHVNIKLDKIKATSESDAKTLKYFRHKKRGIFNKILALNRLTESFTITLQIV